MEVTDGPVRHRVDVTDLGTRCGEVGDELGSRSSRPGWCAT